MYSRLTRNATVSVAQVIFSGLVLFVVYRYLIDHLGAEQLGLWSVVLASTSVARLSDMGLTGSVVKFVARYRALKDEVQAADVVQTAAISIAGVMAILCIAVYPLLDDVLALAVPEKSMAQALLILPWAVFSLWIGSVGSVFQSALDGCQRMDIRNVLMVVGNILFLVATLCLVPGYGLVGLAIGQIMQGTLLLLVSWLTLRRQLKSLPWLPMLWSKAKFKEMLGYAVNFQINAIAILLFDSIIKLLMSRYGGLSSAGYYEMANQLVAKLRALLISANQALVPTVAELHEAVPEKIRELYLKVYRMLLFVSFPLYAGILISLPIISVLWIGHIEAHFLLFGALLCVGWGINTLIAPAYFINLGTGNLKWNTIAHVSMAIINLLLGLFLGKVVGALGVVIAAMTALVFASGLVIFALHRQYQISFGMIFPREHIPLMLAAIVSIALSGWLNIDQFFGQKTLLVGAINIGIFTLLMLVCLWLHPYKKILLERFVKRI
jgi:O-antigen/teichoic acid export membrane protein